MSKSTLIKYQILNIQIFFKYSSTLPIHLENCSYQFKPMHGTHCHSEQCEFVNVPRLLWHKKSNSVIFFVYWSDSTLCWLQGHCLSTYLIKYTQIKVDLLLLVYLMESSRCYSICTAAMNFPTPNCICGGTRSRYCSEDSLVQFRV